MATSPKRRIQLDSDPIVATLMLVPAVALLGLFFIWPFFRGLWISLTRWDGFSNPTFVGLTNYLRLLHDHVFLGAIENNLIFVVLILIFKNTLGLGLAMLLDRAIFLRGPIRAAVFIPVTLSFAATGLLWSWIYNPVFGLLNAALDLVGLSWLKQSWLGDADIALYSIVAVDIWKWLGFHAVIYLAGLQTIPQELYEAARMDGAKAFSRFRHLTLPLMMPVVLINVILGLSGAFVRNFDIVQVLTQGGPNHATEVVMTLMVKTAFQDGNMGYASAMGYALFLIVALGCVALLGLMRRAKVDM
ncbi:sugar ABC transporter permease [Rhizobium sp. VS19-DR104.2]|uniref:carbohydrate ABC transporter permease n=1 Tax=unclassified Rhizobium TaxID=2613769 RepID=UPI001CC5F977|nr:MULTISPECIES: sugar ABC transporter permease [unclassified Rhizobium]MBZ5762493.1 sugar ABC transporter permease [Rhizobium sp. VS19-DR96]MBZ5768492.1 sugar ABC transporter permease [Rhizobium sp. VS19-DR129.2]MBZ5776010.1 sugar ABC transporter permease [Rhizobium sp. VS19-DRK62.2]MBZ5787218.1 sugar ABC transporter permease [Rhizobium sp. VS19-DR121]MBZ5804571.1 sugar ABC transporter permease [Rhizobium sp. VS19-DR181]